MNEKMSEKYWDEKVKEIFCVIDSNELDESTAIAKILRQIATDQREACVKSLDECSRFVGCPGDVIYYKEAVEQIRNGAIGKE